MNRFIFFILLFFVMFRGYGQNRQDTLVIEGSNIWIREYPKTGKVVLKLNDGDVCKVLERGEAQTIRGKRDFWYKIDYQGQTGWVFGSQSNIKQGAFVVPFEPFLKEFLSKCFWGTDIDSLIYFKSSLSKSYIHKDIGFTRLYNPGTWCIPQEFSFDSDYNGRPEPVINNPVFYTNQLPGKGFCEESPESDGVYYDEVESLPKYPDMTDSGDIVMHEINIPVEYKDGKKMIVKILHKGWIIKTMYFMEANGRWWLVLFDDCDCSS